MASRQIRLLPVPLGLGAGEPGAQGGPGALLAEGLAAQLRTLGYECLEDPPLDVPAAGTLPEDPRARAHHLGEIARVCNTLARRVRASLAAGETPIVLGGDHSIAAGSVAGAASHLRASQRRLGVLWVDAHADMNTPDVSPSGNVHGMSLAASLGLRVPELANLEGFAPKVDHQHIALVGVRDIDREEADLIRRRGVHVYTMRDVDIRGMFNVMNEAIERVSQGTAGYHVSLDIDALDPALAAGTGTRVPGGLTYREAHLAMEMVADSGRMLSCDCVEVNPLLDPTGATARLAVGLLASALGKNILHAPPAGT